MKFSSSNFLVLGRAGMDLYADPVGTRTEQAQQFFAALGGSAANIAVAICKLGGAASLITVVSDDAVGRFVLNELQRYGVGSHFVRSVGGEVRTSLAVVETRFENCQSVIYRNGASDFVLEERDVRRIPYADFAGLIVTGTSLALEPSRAATLLAIDLAQQAGCPVILDVDYRPYSWSSAEDASSTCMRAAAACEFIIGNDVEFAMMAQGDDGFALAQTLAREARRIVVYKKGENGAVTFGEGQAFSSSIYNVTPLKPTGAGDSFMGGFLMGLANDASLQDAVLQGSAAAAITVTRVGCAPALPTLSELENFMATNRAPHHSTKAFS